MRVLQLVTNDTAPFFRQQIKSLEAVGVTCEVRSPADRESSSRSVRDYLRFARESFRESSADYDLVHANYGVTAPAALLQREQPVVLSLWGSDLLGRVGPLSQLCARHADEVIVMTPAMADVLAEPSHVIPHGIDMERFRPIPTARARQEIGWTTEAYQVLFPYSPDRAIKDFPTAASVVAAVRQQVANPVHLQTLSGVAHDRMPYYHNAADAVLLTSKREGSPNVVREALACNTPVAATAVGDVARWLDGCPPAGICHSQQELVDRLTEILVSDHAMESREQIVETSAAEMGRQLERVYERALTGETPVSRPETSPPKAL